MKRDVRCKSIVTRTTRPDINEKHFKYSSCFCESDSYTLLLRYDTALFERFSVMKQITLTTLFWPFVEFLVSLEFNKHKLMNTEKRGKFKLKEAKVTYKRIALGISFKYTRTKLIMPGPMTTLIFGVFPLLPFLFILINLGGGGVPDARPTSSNWRSCIHNNVQSTTTLSDLLTCYEI